MLVMVSVLSFTELSLYSQEASADKPAEKKDEGLKISGFIDVITTLRLSSECKTELGKSQMNLYLLGLNLDGKHDFVGYHATVHITGTGYGTGSTTTKNFSDMHTPVWLDEAYVYSDIPLGESKLKVGSVRVPFGLQGDNSWYYSYHYYAGLSVDSDYGSVLDINKKLTDKVKLNVALAYFLVDDRINGSRNAGLTDLTIESDNNIEERDTFVGRLALSLDFKPVEVTIGGSVLMGTISNTAGPDSSQMVFEGDLDLKFTTGNIGIRAFGEFISANRNKDNVASIGSKEFNLWLAGLSLSYDIKGLIKSIDIHGNYAQVDRAAGVKSDLLIVGPGIAVSDTLTVNIEYVMGKNDTSLAMTNNRFDEGLFIDFFYTF